MKSKCDKIAVRLMSLAILVVMAIGWAPQMMLKDCPFNEFSVEGQESASVTSAAMQALSCHRALEAATNEPADSKLQDESSQAHASNDNDFCPMRSCGQSSTIFPPLIVVKGLIPPSQEIQLAGISAGLFHSLALDPPIHPPRISAS